MHFPLDIRFFNFIFRHLFPFSRSPNARESLLATLQTSAKWFQLGGSAYTNARLQEDRNPPRFMKWKIKSLGQLPFQ